MNSIANKRNRGQRIAYIIKSRDKLKDTLNISIPATVISFNFIADSELYNGLSNGCILLKELLLRLNLRLCSLHYNQFIYNLHI